MQGTIESLMADQAKKTVGQYVEWIGSYVEGALEDINNMRRQQEDAAGKLGVLSTLNLWCGLRSGLCVFEGQRGPSMWQ